MASGEGSTSTSAIRCPSRSPDCAARSTRSLPWWPTAGTGRWACGRAFRRSTRRSSSVATPQASASRRGMKQALGPGALLLRGFAAAADAQVLAGLQEVLEQAPFRHMITPGGYRMSVALTNCGSLGWVTDRTGYRYDAADPETGKHWPPMPAAFLRLAHDAAAHAGFDAFVPDACLVNQYLPGA